MTKTAAESRGAKTVTADEIEQAENANASGKTPVVFVHGLWLLPSSWDRWAKLFDAAGYAPVLPGWPDDPESVDDANEHPEVFARKGVADIADHVEAVISRLDRRPALIGHSFGGLLVQILAGRGSRRPPLPSTQRRSAASCPCRSLRCDRRRPCCATRSTAIEPSP